jgi:hypothetical protein
MPTLKSLVSDLVSQTRLDKALALAKQHALTGWIEFDTPITMVTAEWDHVKKTALRGMLSFREESTARQGLTFHLLSMVEDMDKTPGTNAPDGRRVRFSEYLRFGPKCAGHWERSEIRHWHECKGF